MIQNVLSDIGGVGLYGVISICIFMGVFFIAMLWMVRLSRRYIHAMKQLPLEDDISPAPNTLPKFNPNEP